MWDLWQERAKPIVPVITIEDLAHAVPLANALVSGGVRMLEITLRTACAWDAIRAVQTEVPEAIVGVGTVTSTEQFERAAREKVSFVVSPGATDTLLDCAKEWGGAYLPGVATPSEVMRARDAGFKRQKFFPAGAAGGSAMLSALSAPLSDVMFCPTGGIGSANMAEFLALPNVFAVGGSWLTPTDLVKSQNWAAINALAIAS